MNPNKMHKSQSLFYLTTALHVSGVTITHLLEHKTTVTTASGNSYVCIFCCTRLLRLFYTVPFCCFLLFAGSHPAEAVGVLGRKNPQHAFLRRESKAVGQMS